LNTYNKYGLITAITVIIAMILYFFTPLFVKEAPPALEKVTIAASLTLSPALIWIAHDKGFFKQAGLDATIKQYSSGKTTTEAMLKGEMDLSASAEFLAVKKSFKHKELRILGTTAFVHQIKLLGLKERGIANVSDIKGKRIGVRLGTNGEYFLARLLTLNGLKQNDITWVNIKPQEKARAMAEGLVDAVLTWPPFVQQVQKQLGEKVITFDGQPGQDYYYLLLTRKDWIDSNPHIAEKVMTALKRAEQWFSNNPQQAKDYMSSKFNIKPQKMSQILGQYRFSISFPQSLLIAMEAENHWILNQSNIKEQPVTNFLQLMLFEPLKKTSPADVTIVH
jgi:ABC-type nitrate/sulfonate/bicarbonate transport system substrate-binding protein